MFFRVTRNDISPALTRLIRAAKPPERKRILRAMGTTFKSITEGTFNSVGASYRPAKWPAKYTGEPSNLQKSTTLAKSFQLEVTDSTAKVSTHTIYGNVHQFGATIRAKGRALSWLGPEGKRIFAKSVTIPPRPFFPVLDGHLTRPAEEKIAAAGERVLQNIAHGK